MRLLDVALAKNMEDILACGDEIIGDDAAMAAPPQALRAHDTCARGFTQFAQGSKARPEFLAHGVVGVIVEARVLPEGVGLGQNVALRSAQPAERGKMLVSDPAGGERSGQGVAVELRIEA